MKYTTLGRTGLKVSIMGLGGGGESRLGQAYNNTESESVRLVREAVDNGINIIDTAECYHTQPFVGKALKELNREEIIISTKKNTWGDENPLSEKAIRKSLEEGLEQLNTDYIDIYHLHSVGVDLYPYIKEEVVPILYKLRDEGKIRFLGITEEFGKDSSHLMLQEAVKDDFWDVMMVGFNILNQSAHKTIFPITTEKKIGTLLMFGVRNGFSKPERLKEILNDLIKRGKIDKDLLDAGDNPLGFLIHETGASSLTDAAYRFCRSESGIDVILSGTGNIEHLRANIKSITSPELPESDLKRIRKIFENVDDVSGG